MILPEVKSGDKCHEIHRKFIVDKRKTDSFPIAKTIITKTRLKKKNATLKFENRTATQSKERILNTS